MRRSVRSIQAAKYGYIVSSVLLCLLGVVTVVYESASLSAIGIAAGILFILFGIFKLIGYFSRDLYRLAFQFDLASGILFIALSVVLLVRPVVRVNFLCVLLGVVILSEGLFKIQTALDARRFGLRTWWVILTLALLVGIMSMLMVVRLSQTPEALQTILGLTLILEGLLSLAVSLCAVKIVDHQLSEED